MEPSLPQERSNFDTYVAPDKPAAKEHTFAQERAAISPLQTKLIFAFAFALLSMIAIGLLQYRTLRQLQEDNRSVAHTQDILRELEAVRNSLNRADAFVQGFVVTGQNTYLEPYNHALADLQIHIDTLRTLTADNPVQHRSAATLQALSKESIRALQAEEQARNAGTLAGQHVLLLESSIRKAAGDVRGVTGEMETAELQLLTDRRQQARATGRQTDLFIWFGTIMGFALLCSAGVGLYLDLSERGKAQESRLRAFADLQRAKRELEQEVQKKTEAQIKLQDSERSLRQLSVNLLKTQDEERRRIGRELHDSLGQYLSVLKMDLDILKQIAARTGDASAQEQLAECATLADQSIREVRTVSYLLHPPLLEELGLRSAIPVYVEGFAKRSGIQIACDIPPDFGRLPADVEFAIFRVLQESLTNVHRHSGSPTAHVELVINGSGVMLAISDQGRGIPPEKAGKFGVGFHGMTERMRELGGTLEMDSTERGTTIRATVPQTPTKSARAASA